MAGRYYIQLRQESSKSLTSGGGDGDGGDGTDGSVDGNGSDGDENDGGEGGNNGSVCSNFQNGGDEKVYSTSNLHLSVHGYHTW